MASNAKIYEKHNLETRGREFLVMGNERKYLLKKFIKGSNLKICDIAGRDGALTGQFVEGNEFWSVDFDTKALDFMRDKYGAKTVCQDLNEENWDLPENYFDIVVFSEVLEHLYYPEEILKRLSKIIKPGGLLLGSVPNAFSLKNRIRLALGQKKHTSLEDPTHINHFSHSELLNLLDKNFGEAEIIPIIQKKYRFLSKISPSLFSFMLFFRAKK